MPKALKQTQKLALFSFLFVLSTFTTGLRAEITATLSNGQSLELLGIGMHQELRNDIYVGALFGPAGITDVEQLKDDNIAKRMSIKLVTEYSSRKMSRHWKERLAMNNPRENWRPLTKEIVLFSRNFKRGFQLGDELNIDHIPGVGTQVYLNGTLFQTIDAGGFVDLLLNVWLGTNPPTKAFKSSIRGQDSASVKASYIAKYQALQPIAGRFDADLAPVQVAKQEPEEPTVEKKTPSPKNEPVKKQAQAQKPVVKKKPEPEKKVENKSTPQLVAKPKLDIKPKINLDNSNNSVANASKKSGNDTPSEPKKEVPKAQPKAAKVAKIEKPVEETLDDDFFDADLLSGSYTRDLINAIRKFEEYPKKALVKGEQGDVVAKVVINAQGEIEELDLIERSGSRILDRAVIRMVKKAAPFEKIPTELEQTTFEFEVPISFKL
ncbi:TonB family protein [Aliikangiella sp. G2MR2-5]|uniref:TonB family protein n=1 Tax=Aliikangiella sp. G2MR2-5 TaxID=2788943 RepID=UPI0018AC4033|nr:TonB family protein [Aliikangiella sp. G2MR2-5]